ncbi:MAG TPA: CoA transferase, partial [Myxococcota bacterium]|nr:CoA transferase [Myxococcota bacterium]
FRALCSAIGRPELADDDRVVLAGVRGAAAMAPEALVVGELGPPDRAAERAEELVAGGRDRDPAVARVGNQHPFTAPYDAFAARDGWVAIATASNKLFRALCGAIGRPELPDDERFRSHRGRAAHRREINAIVAEWAGDRTVEEALAALGPRGARIPCARVAAPEELLDDPQLAARGMIERHAHPGLGEIVLHGNPLKLSAAAPRERALAPALGADNAAVYGALGVSADDLERLSRDGVI